MLNEIISTVKKLVGSDILYFDTAVQVKLTPHTLPFNAWAVSVSPKDELFVMNADEQWFEIEAKDSLLIQSLYQRTQLISKQYEHAA